MVETKQLIAQLSEGATPVRRLGLRWRVAAMLVVVMLYAVASQGWLGLRGDLWQQLANPIFLVEIAVLLLMLLSAAIAAVHLAHPDAGQQHRLLIRLPYGCACLIVVVMACHPWMPLDFLPPPEGSHSWQCAMAIAMLAVLPAMGLMLMVRQGATVMPALAGGYATMAATALGMLVLRLAEANDQMSHLIFWHYLPSMAMAILGAWLGRLMLRW